MDINTNLIYHGDCYNVLKRYFPTGDDKQGIDLIYIDPPFSFDPKYARLWYDKESLEVFEELRKGGVKHYIAWMSKRLEQCHRVLKDTGSIYLHCDWKFGHYLKVEMDNIFGRNNFVNEIIWSYQGTGNPKRSFKRKHDTIFLYGKTGKYYFNSNEVQEPITEKSLVKYTIVDEKGRKYKHYKHPDGIYYRKYLDTAKTMTMRDVWEISIIQSFKERLGYPTQKPETLLDRIIRASSKEENTVLDPMCGCGTTIAVAHELNRRWIGIDISSQACELMRKRMEKLEDIANVQVIGLPLTIKDLENLDHFEFQDYICDMTNSEKTKHVADEGIDGYYLGETPLQIKQQERVGRAVVDNFETALRRKGKDEGYVIGFSFTSPAYEEAARAKDDGLDISLIKVDELIKRDYELETLLE